MRVTFEVENEGEIFTLGQIIGMCEKYKEEFTNPETATKLANKIHKAFYDSPDNPANIENN